LSNKNIIPVILAGGVGRRLWPLSREQHPKQFIRVESDYSMLQDSMRRLSKLSIADQAIVICNEEHRFLVRGQLKEVGLSCKSIILEPVGRGTAAATVIAALAAMNIRDDSLILVLPADHIIQSQAGFSSALKIARIAERMNHFVAFGAPPNRIETGYGYLRLGEEVASKVYRVSEFVEKPDARTAEEYLLEGSWHWNSGIFLLPAKTFLDEVKAFEPDMFRHCCSAYQGAQLDGEFFRLEESNFKLCRTDSIDRAVMEKTNRALVVLLNAGWSDGGSWQSLWEIGQKDDDGNVSHGDVITLETRNTYIHSDRRLITTLGVDDLVIVDSRNAVLVMQRDRAQDVDKVVAELTETGRVEHEEHCKVYRPWGSYEVVDRGEGFQVKRITVNPNGRLSLQAHQRRSEHWIVVSGSAVVTSGQETFSLKENESTFIPSGTRHRFENQGKEDLMLIEVQTGSYFGEDDIIRYEDDYGRNSTDL